MGRMMSVEGEWKRIQIELDRRDVQPGHEFTCNYNVLGNGSAESPMLAPVGVDRIGRLWSVSGNAIGKVDYRLIMDATLPVEAIGTLTKQV